MDAMETLEYTRNGKTVKIKNVDAWKNRKKGTGNKNAKGRPKVDEYKPRDTVNRTIPMRIELAEKIQFMADAKNISFNKVAMDIIELEIRGIKKTKEREETRGDRTVSKTLTFRTEIKDIIEQKSSECGISFNKYVRDILSTYLEK